ncbi:MAG: nuclear transport factor 2 family protein [Ginsengibacter sp.]
MKSKTVCQAVLFTIVFAACSAHVFAQTEQQKLTATILHLDSAFWNTYNSCDTAHFKDFVTDDVEFYQDKGGITNGAKSLIESLNKNICGNANSRLRREAVAGTVKVYPMQNGAEIYGAVISGEHKFYITQNGKPEFQSGVANFTQLWQLKNGVWKMTRILSYNHHEP